MHCRCSEDALRTYNNANAAVGRHVTLLESELRGLQRSRSDTPIEVEVPVLRQVAEIEVVGSSPLQRGRASARGTAQITARLTAYQLSAGGRAGTSTPVRDSLPHIAIFRSVALRSTSAQAVGERDDLGNAEVERSGYLITQVELRKQAGSFVVFQ